MRPSEGRPLPTARSAAYAPRVARACGLSLLLLLSTLLLPLASAQVMASTYRVDVGAIAPGATREGSITLSNPTYEAVHVRFATEGAAPFVRLPESLELRPGESRDVAFVYAPPRDAPPGHHGEAVRLMAREANGTAGIGTMLAGTAILFTSRVSAVGPSVLEGPALVLPEERVAGRVLVVNTWNATVNASVRLRWLDAANLTVATATLGPQEVAAGGFASYAYNLSSAPATPGAQAIEAQVALDGDAPASARLLRHEFLLGIRAANYTITKLADARDGNATVDVELRNTGTVPITLRPRVLLRGEAGAYEATLDPVTLQPGEVRTVVATLALPPGRFLATLSDAEESALEPASLAQGGIPLEVRAPVRPADLGALARVAALAGGLLLLAGLGVLASRRHPPAALLARWRDARAAARREAAADPMEDLFARLEREEATHAPAGVVRLGAGGHVAILVDLASLGATAGAAALVPALAAGRPVAAARAYAAAGDEHEAARAFHELDACGFVPHVRSQRDFRVEIALDAVEAARARQTIILCTHDAAFAELARRLRAQGARVEVAGVGPRLPVPLREEADAVHDLAALAATARAAGRAGGLAG